MFGEPLLLAVMRGYAPVLKVYEIAWPASMDVSATRTSARRRKPSSATAKSYRNKSAMCVTAMQQRCWNCIATLPNRPTPSAKL